MNSNPQLIPTADQAWRALLEALLTLAPENFDVASLMSSLVEVARVLTSANHGALQLIDKDGRVSEYTFTGFDDTSDAAKLPHFVDEDSGEVKPGVISVPITRAERLYGRIFLAEKSGASAFTPEDSKLLQSLAAIAGAAVERASLGAEHLRRKRMVDGITSLTRAVIEGATEDAIEDITCEQARQIHDADIAVMALAKSPRGEFRVVRCERDSGLVVEGEAMLHISPAVIPGGQRIFVPIVADGKGIGTILIANNPGAKEFDEFDKEILQTFADRAALTIQFTRARRELARIAVYEERERIARDLHDTVIQELFAAGIGIEAIIPMTQGEVAERLHETVGALDHTIHDLRSMIFKLESEPHDDSNIRAIIESVANEQLNALGFLPRVEVIGPVNSVLTHQIREDLTAVIREALANVARHACASEVRVTLEIIDKEIVLTIEDNGSGSENYFRQDGHGISNIIGRARAHGGEATIQPGASNGTIVEWRIPWAPSNRDRP